jgi:hypothetical protein
MIADTLQRHPKIYHYLKLRGLLPKGSKVNNDVIIGGELFDARTRCKPIAGFRSGRHYSNHVFLQGVSR